MSETINADLKKETFLSREAGGPLGGVCFALAKKTGLRVGGIRLVFVILTLFYGTGVPLYLGLWMSMPIRGKAERIVFGSCLRLSMKLGIDLSLVRLFFVGLSLLGGGGLVLYLLISLLMPSGEKR